MVDSINNKIVFFDWEGTLASGDYLMMGASQNIKTLHDNGFKIIILSNSDHNWLENTCKKLGLSDYLSNIVGDGVCRYKKPSKEIALFALEGVGISLVDMQMQNPTLIFVGDSEADIKCGINIGATPILINNYGMSSADYGQKHTVYDHEELSEILYLFID